MSTKLISAIEEADNFTEALREVYKRAATDPEYRELALNDPKAAFDAIGADIEGWDLKFVEPEEGVDDVLQLPEAVETAPELSEEELEAVAGGQQELDRSVCTLTDWPEEVQLGEG
jgi:hypothetical protein